MHGRWVSTILTRSRQQSPLTGIGTDALSRGRISEDRPSAIGKPIRKIVDRFFVQMLLHGKSDILSQTTFPCRLEEIRLLLWKDASGIVQYRIMFESRMECEPYFDLISARGVQDRGNV